MFLSTLNAAKRILKELRSTRLCSASITNNWKLLNADYDRTWEITEAEGIEYSTLSGIIRLYNYSNMGQEDVLISPNINLLENKDYHLYFSYAHQNRDIGTRDDSLIVEVSIDCGTTFYPVFAKGGNALETTDTLDLNFEPSYASHWNSQIVDLSEYIPNASSMILKFTAVNGKQNNLYLDNIVVSTAEEFTVVDFETNKLKVSPNPAKNSVRIDLDLIDSPSSTIQLIDASGRLIDTRTTIENAIIWDISHLEPGYYIFKLNSNSRVKTCSFIKKR